MEYTIIFMIGAAGYSIMEILWRGYTHWTMTLTGGVCFLLIYLLHRVALPIYLKIPLCGALITSVEFAVGCVVNRLLGWGIWDYSRFRFQLWGQICLPYALLWIALAAGLLPLCRVLSRAFS